MGDTAFALGLVEEYASVGSVPDSVKSDINPRSASFAMYPSWQQSGGGWICPEPQGGKGEVFPCFCVWLAGLRDRRR